MKTSTYEKTMFFLGLAGVLFSGYLSAVKLFSSTCAFNEPCPYFLGYPACWFGFGLFLIIFLAAVFGLARTIEEKYMSKITATVSGLGIIFAGYFTIPEIQILLSGVETNYTLVLPTCAYGLVFFVIIFILSITRIKRNRIEI